MKKVFSLLLFCVLMLGCGFAQDTCADYDGLFNRVFTWLPSNTILHGNGSHYGSFTFRTDADYIQLGGQLPDGSWPCQVEASGNWSHVTYDTGEDRFINMVSQTHLRGDNEGAFVTPGGWSADQTVCGVWGFSVNSCSNDPEYPDPGCSIIPISLVNCTNVTFLPGHEGNLGELVWEVAADSGNVVYPYIEAQAPTPIVIDLDGRDYEDAFTDIAHGVLFNFYGRGLMKMSWTNPARNIGFLWLDRDDCKGCVLNGVVDNAGELFGSKTIQPLNEEQGKVELAREKVSTEPFHPNGFQALSFFDWPKNGGTGQGLKIDKQSKVWPNLRVWIDTSHTGDSRMGKNYTLDELGIKSISLKYERSSWTDSYGNKGLFKGTIEMVDPTATQMTIYDVSFVTK